MGSGRLTVYTFQKFDCDALLHFLEEMKMPHFTYARKEKKTKELVLLCLPPLEEDEVKEDLSDAGLRVFLVKALGGKE